jgi:uncharacterized protein
MPALPPRPDLDQLKRLSKELVRAAKMGEPSAVERLRAASAPVTLAGAQLAIAREYGFSSWARLKRAVERREILDARDLERLRTMLSGEPDLSWTTMERWGDHPKGASPLGYVAMLRYDTASGVWRYLEGTGAVARALIAAGAPVDGRPGDPETPVITAASYGDADVARVLIEAGADVEARATEEAGGVPGGTALLHAAVFGMTPVVDVLIAAGAQVHSIEEAAAAGDVTGWLDDRTPSDAALRALVMAAHHQRLDVIDRLIGAGVAVDGVDPAFGGHPLRTAASEGRPASVRRLLEHGADPDLRDPESGLTPLALCRRSRASGSDSPGHREVETILGAVTADGGNRGRVPPATNTRRGDVPRSDGNLRGRRSGCAAPAPPGPPRRGRSPGARSGCARASPAGRRGTRRR